MRKILSFIPSSLLMLCLFACQHRYPTALVEIDSLMYTNPKLAYEKLCSFQKSGTTVSEQDSLYCFLLKTLTKDKLYRPIDESKKLKDTLDYCLQYKDMLPKVYYVKGRMMQGLHEIPLALSCYHKVLDNLKDSTDLYLQGSTCSQIGNLMSELNDFSQAEKFYRKAFYCDSLLGNSRAMVFDFRDLAIADMEQLGTIRSLDNFKQALSLATKIDDKNLVNDIRLQIANVYLYNTDNLDSVWVYLEPSLREKNPVTRATCCLVASEYFWACLKDDSVKFYLNDVLRHGDLLQRQEAFKSLSRVYANEDSVLIAHRYLEEYLMLDDSVALQKEKEQSQNGLALFNYICQKEEIDKLQTSNLHRLFFILLLFVLLLAVVFVLVFYCQMSVVRKLKVKNKMVSLRLIMLSQKERKNAYLKTICDKLNLQQIVEAKKCMPSDVWKMIEHEVGRCNPNFRDNLYSCYQLSEFEYQICLLIKLGMGTSQIAILTAHAKTSISMAKQRLYFKITGEKGKAEDLNRILLCL